MMNDCTSNIRTIDFTCKKFAWSCLGGLRVKAPGDTNPSDATATKYFTLVCWNTMVYCQR